MDTDEQNQVSKLWMVSITEYKIGLLGLDTGTYFTDCHYSWLNCCLLAVYYILCHQTQHFLFLLHRQYIMCNTFNLFLSTDCVWLTYKRVTMTFTPFWEEEFYGHLTTVSSCKSHKAQLTTVRDMRYMMPVTVENNHHHLFLHFLGIKQT